jgi:phosphinothricin acetyltransferase
VLIARPFKERYFRQPPAGPALKVYTRGGAFRHAAAALLQSLPQRHCHPVSMAISFASASDLPAIVAIYNAAIPGRMATADTEPVTVTARATWFSEFDRARRPLWVFRDDRDGTVSGWLSLRSFYGRPAYDATVEIGVYVDPSARRHSVAKSLLAHALAAAPALAVKTILAFVFAHNAPSLALFAAAGFAEWGRLPGVATLDGIERDLAILGRRIAGS